MPTSLFSLKLLGSVLILLSLLVIVRWLTGRTQNPRAKTPIPRWAREGSEAQPESQFSFGFFPKKEDCSASPPDESANHSEEERFSTLGQPNPKSFTHSFAKKGEGMETVTRGRETEREEGILHHPPDSGVRPAEEASDENPVAGFETLLEIRLTFTPEKEGGFQASFQIFTPKGGKEEGKKPWFPPPNLVEKISVKLLEGFRSSPQELVSGSKAKPEPSFGGRSKYADLSV